MIVNLENKKLLSYPKLIVYPNPKLKIVSKYVPFSEEHTFPLINILKEELNKNLSSVGLSAIQIGIPERVMLIKEDGKKDYTVIVNPKILKQDKNTNLAYEGCLSIPWYEENKRRSNSVYIEYDLMGDTNFIGKTKRVLTGRNARIFLHEYDHFEGILIND